MKKIISFLLVSLMLFTMTVTSFATKSEPTTVEIIDFMSKKKQQAGIVNLLLGGKGIFTDVPAMLYGSRTLVPIRFVAENLGAQVQWDEKAYTATIITADKTIILKIDSATATVNGKKVTLPDKVPAKLLGYKGNYRTMVPLRFVSEQLGMDVNWIDQTKTATIDLPKQSITAIEYSKAYQNPQVRIRATGAVSYNTMFLQGSKVGGNDRIVIDVPNVMLDVQDSSIVDAKGSVRREIGEIGVTAVRSSVFETAPRSVIRVVIDLAKEKEYKISFDQITNEIVVEFFNNYNNVKEIKIENKNYIEALVIRTDDIPVYEITEANRKITLDIFHAELRQLPSEQYIGKGGISSVRTEILPMGTYDGIERGVRVEIFLESGTRARDVIIENDKNDIFLYLGKMPPETFKLEKITPKQSLLNIELDGSGKYFVEYDEIRREIELRVPKNKIELPNTTLNIYDPILETITIDDTSNAKYYIITIKLMAETVFVVESEDRMTNQVQIRFENNKAQSGKYKDRIIVIDPGHGGKDPGAVSPKLKLKEKDLVLDVSNRLNKLLQDAGFTTYLTRTNDTFIGLYDRPGVANEIKADVLVSVHFNAHANPAISGVEVLYNPNTNKGSKNLASIMKDEIVKELKATDMGIKERPNLVVIREAKMPSVLTELAFLTNASEEALVETDEYRQKCAQALFNGIKRYFDEVILK